MTGEGGTGSWMESWTPGWNDTSLSKNYFYIITFVQLCAPLEQRI
ncbi:hypothetical protein [Wolbachia endosymbiont (group A) of Cheilosia soror]|nr:hypothetical protein [Wolbachia endosymbiont (group A) of Cheilosia soror]